METLATSLLGSNPTLSTVAITVIVLVIVALATGALTPKWITKSLLESRDERVAQANLRAEDYKSLYETEHAALDASQKQVTELLVTAQTTRKIVEALPAPPIPSEIQR